MKSLTSNKRKSGNLRLFFRNSKAVIGLVIFSVFVLIAIFAGWIAPYNPQVSQFLPMQPPSLQNLLGTTSTGQDIFSQFVWGTQTTMIVGVGAGLLSTFIGILVGVYAGYKGGWVDSVLNTIANIFLVLPGLALLILIESYVKNTTPYSNGLIIALTGWAWGARVFRAQAMSLAGRDFIIAAKLSGASDLRIIFVEILPNMMSIIAANVMYACLGAILAESGLAYLGLENLSSNSWGTMLYWAQAGGAMLGGAWWWFIPPGLAIALVGMSFALMNFSIDQITNPRLRVRKMKNKASGVRKVESHGRENASA